MISIGQNQINQIYAGNTSVQSVYVGSTQVWSGKSWHTLYEGDGSWLDNIPLNAYTTSDRVVQYRNNSLINFANTWGTYGEPVKYRIYIEGINYGAAASSSTYTFSMSDLSEPTPVTPFYIESDDNNEIIINSTLSGEFDPSKIYLQFTIDELNGANNLRFNVYYAYQRLQNVGYYYVYSVNPKITKIEAYY